MASSAGAGVAMPGSVKRNAAGEEVGVEYLSLQPLGAGCEVGRSCHILRYKGKTIMLDCGILPSFQGIEALPLVQEVNPADIDIIFITHFHLDHCAALPHFTERMTGFKGRIFATHPTIAVMRMVLQDFVRVTTIASDDPNALYDQRDIDACLARIEAVDLRQKVNVDGVQFLFFNAGHVLGAAMVLLEIAGVRILYTGDYSCEEDRHLMAAEVPRDFPPNVLIVEATYGMQVHEGREQRERRFTEAVEKIVKRGGRVLIPVFALGRAQELLLILEEYWAANPHLRNIPIYHASKMAGKSLEVYRTYISHMNARIQKQMGDRNPWNFQFIRDTSPGEFKDSGPCVVLAAPGMLQNGFSRQLFDRWCEDPRNGIILAGYSVEGTLARQLEQNPVEVESSTKRKLIRRCAIERVSFSAHADSVQTSHFVEALKPGAIILVHGERNEMKRLHTSLARKYEASPGFRGVYMPRNNEAVKFRFAEEKIVKLIGSLADRALKPGARVSGILVHHNFETLLLAPAELSRFTQLATHTLSQKLHVPYRSTFAMLKAFVVSMYSDSVEGVTTVPLNPSLFEQKPKQTLTVSNLVTVTHCPPDRVILTWSASPVADMVADSLVAVIAQAEVSQASIKATSKPCNHAHGSGADHDHSDHDGHEHGSGAAASAAAAQAAEDYDADDVAPQLGVAPTAGALAAVTRPDGTIDAAAAEGASGMDIHSVSSPSAISDSAELGEFPPAAKADMAASTEWSAAVPWAREILESDSGPLAPAASSSSTAAGEAGRPVSDVGAQVQHAAKRQAMTPSHDSSASWLLLPPVKRRKDMLMRMLCDQYGKENVVDRGPVISGEADHATPTEPTPSDLHGPLAPAVSSSTPAVQAVHAVPQSFSVGVTVDDKSGEIKYLHGSGFSVTTDEGRDDKVRLGSALERTVDLVDTLFRPVHR